MKKPSRSLLMDAMARALPIRRPAWRWSHYDKTRAQKVVPSLLDLLGIAPNCTGELSSEDFVRRERDER